MLLSCFIFFCRFLFEKRPHWQLETLLVLMKNSDVGLRFQKKWMDLLHRSVAAPEDAAKGGQKGKGLLSNNGRSAGVAMKVPFLEGLNITFRVSNDGNSSIFVRFKRDIHCKPCSGPMLVSGSL